jgi:RNA polymerase sigma-70 factor (ECF subfamily)
MAIRIQPSLQTRRSLLSRIKDWQDRESWQQFYDTYSNLIYGVALAAGLSHQEAEEVLQETVLTVAKKLRANGVEKPAFTYDPELGSFKSWLLHTTRWRITDQFRKRVPLFRKAANYDSPTDRTPTEAQIPDPSANGLEANWDQEWKQTLQEAALERVKRTVKAKHYQVFDLYVLKRWPVEKVARILGLNAGQVFVAKHRILALVKKEVKRLQKEIL